VGGVEIIEESGTYWSPHTAQAPCHAAASASPTSQTHPASSWRSSRASSGRLPGCARPASAWLRSERRGSCCRASIAGNKEVAVSVCG